MALRPEEVDELEDLAARVIAECHTRKLQVATAESCTGGLVAAMLTAIPGASNVLERGFVTYSNRAKIELLDVPGELFESVGAVSKAVAVSMADGARDKSEAHIAVSVTGIAGPGGSEGKPEGLVHFACAGPDENITHQQQNFGPIGRNRVRAESTRVALEMLLTGARRDCTW